MSIFGNLATFESFMGFSAYPEMSYVLREPPIISLINDSGQLKDKLIGSLERENEMLRDMLEALLKKQEEEEKDEKPVEI